jgi:hypothetical protein
VADGDKAIDGEKAIDGSGMIDGNWRGRTGSRRFWLRL